MLRDAAREPSQSVESVEGRLLTLRYLQAASAIATTLAVRIELVYLVLPRQPDLPGRSTEAVADAQEQACRLYEELVQLGMTGRGLFPALAFTVPELQARELPDKHKGFGLVLFQAQACCQVSC